MNMSKSRGIQAKIPSPKVIYASNESKSVLARNLEECRDNDKNSQSVFLSFKCIFARNCEVTEQLRMIIIKNVSKELIKNISRPLIYRIIRKIENERNIGKAVSN